MLAASLRRIAGGLTADVAEAPVLELIDG